MARDVKRICLLPYLKSAKHQLHQTAGIHYENHQRYNALMKAIVKASRIRPIVCSPPPRCPGGAL